MKKNQLLYLFLIILLLNINCTEKEDNPMGPEPLTKISGATFVVYSGNNYTYYSYSDGTVKGKCTIPWNQYNTEGLEIWRVSTNTNFNNSSWSLGIDDYPISVKYPSTPEIGTNTYFAQFAYSETMMPPFLPYEDTISDIVQDDFIKLPPMTPVSLDTPFVKVADNPVTFTIDFQVDISVPFNNNLLCSFSLIPSYTSSSVTNIALNQYQAVFNTATVNDFLDQNSFPWIGPDFIVRRTEDSNEVNLGTIYITND